MALDEVFNQAWTRKHDDPTTPVVPAAPRTVYPQSLECVIKLCSTRGPEEMMHAAGSHWALSTAAMSDHTFIETHDPKNIHQALGRTLYEVIPNCMNDAFITALASRRVLPFNVDTKDENLYPIHIETGKRVYQLYAELDFGDDHTGSLANLINLQHNNNTYLGPWAFQTMGGAGGQTVFGALHTGTHGGDIRHPPIADSVMALHLVADGGKHYWIEPASLLFNVQAQLTDDNKLYALYGQDRYGGPDNFHIIRDDDIFYSVLVSAGRFGVVYSFVLAAVPQYTLRQERTLTTWQDIKGLVNGQNQPQINDPTSSLYNEMSGDTENKFLQIAISPTPHTNFSKNWAGITKHRNVPIAVIPGTNIPAGRPERRGDRGDFDPLIQACRFSNAGTAHAYDPDPSNPGKASPASFLEVACSETNFIVGILKAVADEVDQLISTNGAVVGAIIAVAAGPGAGGLLSLLPAFPAALALLKAVIAALEGLPALHFGKVIDDLRKTLLGSSDPAVRQAGLFIWQAIVSKIFSDQQGDASYEAISYAVLDGYDYLDLGCGVNVQSIEVLFDATNPNLIAFVDALLAYEIYQEVTKGQSFSGYISLRFIGKTRALLGMQQFPTTCAIEVAGLADIAGTTALVDYAVMLALSNNFQAIMHWGQRNDSTEAQIMQRFGDPQSNPECALARWRKSLRALTNNGQLNGFSSAFTRQTGLEV
jgi:hypothetical protein